MNRLTLPILLAGCALFAPATADAAKVAMSGSAGPAAELFVVYKGEAGERNNVSVKSSITASADSVTITDTGAKRIKIGEASRGYCKARGAQTVVCKNASLYQLYLGAGDDRARFVEEAIDTLPPDKDPLDRQERQAYPNDEIDQEGGDVTAIVDGGPGDDILAPAFGDTVYPGPGRDVVTGDALTVKLEADGAKDSITGGGSEDEVHFLGTKPVTVDLAARTDGDGDTLTNIDEVGGTPAADTLRGSGAGETFFGGGGGDTIDARGGADLILPDNPWLMDKPAKPAKIVAGAGADVVDARAVAPGTTIACGAGADLMAGNTDDRLDGSCESTFLTAEIGSMLRRKALTPATAKLAPSGDAAIVEVACPAAKEMTSAGCSGQVAVGAQTAPFSLKPGARGSVSVPLGAGVKAGDPVTVHVTGKLLPPAGQTFEQPIDLGWAQVIA
jgi:hypothetical protein